MYAKQLALCGDGCGGSVCVWCVCVCARMHATLCASGKHVMVVRAVCVCHGK